MKKFFSEFREFALRGNVMDLAVAVIIGAAFQAIVASLTQDIISPLIGLVACMDFSDLALAVGGVEIRYGAFLTAVINFIIMALVIFCLVKAIAKLQTLGKKPQEDEQTTKTCPFCRSEIDLLAVRCPHCTAELPEESADAAQ